jgi:GNAT superfamily N-acetyltransferase|tara:strand:+ start:11 stop:469 length:459 start_codon:yes stop_codon:yes gene_type:complete
MRYQQEFLDQVKDDILSLLDLHYKEIALNQDKIKLNPDWDVYSELEQQGKLKIFTARDNDTLVGYFVVVVGVNMHYKDHTFACNDIIYLHKDYRKGFAGIKLIKFAKKCLTEDGVSVLAINTKVHQPFDKVLERLGFNLIERVYSSYLQGDS